MLPCLQATNRWNHLPSHFGETLAFLASTPPVALMGGTLTLWPGERFVKSVQPVVYNRHGTFRILESGLLHAVGS